MHDVVLALALGELDPGHVLVAGEAMHRRAERIADLPQWCGRGDREIELSVHVGDQPGGVLQARHVDVEVHPVDALHLEHHMIGEDISDSAR
jgi:hypothetical protein